MRISEEELEAKLKENPELKMENPLPRLATALEKRKSTNKYNAQRTWSELCQRTFDSRAEARRGEELRLLELAGDIRELRYQIPFVLCVKPKITITIDFFYRRFGLNEPFYEDVKGVLTRDSRTKLAWLQQKYSIEVKLSK